MRMPGMQKLLLGRRNWRALWSGHEGAQLVEFAVVLPLLVVVVVGVADFGIGYTLKDKLTNAARDGARIAVSQGNDYTLSTSSCVSNTPCSVQSAATAAVNYLTNAGVNTCGLTPWSAGPTAGPGAFAWTYTSPSNCPQTTNTMTIFIQRAVVVPVSGTDVFTTRVTISHPFAWTFGNIIKLLVPSASYPSTLTISSVGAMQN